VRSDSAKFFGYFLPKKVTTRTNTALSLRHGMGRDAPRKKNPRPAESAAVCGGKLQSKRLGFGAKCKKPSRLHSLLTHRNLWHAGWRLKRAFRFRKFFGYFLPKKVTTRRNSALSLRHGVGRDAPV
jgi:hypothetical protein